MRIGKVSGRAVLVRESGAVDIEKASGGRFSASIDGILRDWDALHEWASTVEEGLPTLDGALELPLGGMGQAFAVGANYADHVAEANTEVPRYPMVFAKSWTCLVGPGGDIPLPTAKVDWEVELVAVIGRRAERVSVADAWSYVAALTVGQDITERPLQLSGKAPQFMLGKSFPGFGPVGPVLVSLDEFENPDDLSIECRINGEIMQQSRTRELIFSIPELVAYISASCPLLPGDVIFTGTPSGVGLFQDPVRYLRAGDRIESEIEGIGTLVNQAVAGPAYSRRELFAAGKLS
ncbi:fumarylacetoacetate hydrolase family protein [Rhodococcus rhodochrous]|uniref:fumarylacetoacetate hydrolase family protein n=1 Tax=Rhodococcus rhodochrous TaxID=1829 RepID=UPI00031010E1|nr:fumarylacetoacetate hydrolase family protein [Rhodococcus rhodochrous]